MPALTRKLAKLRALSWPEQRLLLTAMLLLPLFWLGLRVLGLQRFQATLDRISPKLVIASEERQSSSQTEPMANGLPPPEAPPNSPLSLAQMTHLGALVNLAARHAPGPATCLTRSLLLRWLLRRRGIESDLRIGVKLDQGRLDAHAWVEVVGVPINDSQDVGQRFAAFSQPLSPEAFN